MKGIAKKSWQLLATMMFILVLSMGVCVNAHAEDVSDGGEGSEDQPIIITEIHATSDIQEPRYNEDVVIPNFTILDNDMLYWNVKDGGWTGGWVGTYYRSGKYEDGTYYLYTSIGVKDEYLGKVQLVDYDELKVYVNGEEWNVDFVSNSIENTCADVHSPGYQVVKPPSKTTLKFKKLASYDIPSGPIGTEISKISVAGSAFVSNYTEDYTLTFTKEKGPDWIEVSETGIISGVRPAEVSANEDLVVRVTDPWKRNAEITIAVGKNYDPSARTKISSIVATSTIKKPEYFGLIFRPEFTIKTGYGATIDTKKGAWYPGETVRGVFRGKTYYYRTTVTIDKTMMDRYCFDDTIAVTVNGVKWKVSKLNISDRECSLTLTSPSYKVTYPGMKMSLKATKKGFKVSWNKITKNVLGYEIQYSTNASFKSAKKVVISNYKTTTKSFTKLKGGKKYYVRMRFYTKAYGIMHYSDWCKTKGIVTKK